jgi:hypothetical protein
MPRYAKNSDNRWLHPNYRKAYCFRYVNNIVYTSVDSKRESTGYDWKPANKKICMEILNQRIYNKQNPQTNPKNSKTIYDLIDQFKKDYLLKQNKYTQKQYHILFRQYLPENLNLDNHKKIREMILNQKQVLIAANNTVWKKIQRLRKLFDFGIDLEWIVSNPVTNSMVPRYINKNIQLYEIEQINLLIEYFKKSSCIVLTNFINCT